MAPIVETYALGPTQTNCYVVRADEHATEGVVVDPGYEGLRPDGDVRAILVTHCHWDHLGGIAALAEATGAPVYMPEREAAVLENPQAFYPDQPIRPYRPEVRLQGDERFEVAGLAFETLFVPGHSPGHVAYATDGAVFSGDVLFAGGVGRTDLPFGDWDTLIASIRTLIDRLPPETLVYPGHGPRTTLAAERERNPFLAELRAAR
ncbi:MAG TPA: MBL fold metallo-hydrolase [Gaiellaceae bacterium]|nr:MBL fold metallo-hydrolase [Gaiellaceae bacterium]